MNIPGRFADILDKQGFAHVATIGPDGAPHNTPVWYDWDGKHLLISQTPKKVKWRNIKREPRVAVSISDPDDPYRNVQLRGRVTNIRADDGRKFIDSLAKAYTGEDEYRYDPPGVDRFIVEITPEHVTTYGS